MSTRRKLSVWLLVVGAFLLWSYAVIVAWSASIMVYVVQGEVKGSDGEPLDGWTVTVENQTRGWTGTATTGDGGAPGAYQVIRLDPFSGDPAAETGDEVVVTFEAPDGRTFERSYVLTDEQVSGARLEVSLDLEVVVETPEDVSGDGVINVIDLVIVAQAFGQSGASLAGDVNADGTVNILDLVLVARRFGTSAFRAPLNGGSLGRATIASRATTSMDSPGLSLRVGLEGPPRGVDGVAGYAVSVEFDPSLLALRQVREGSMLGAAGRTFWISSADSAEVVSFVSVALGSGEADLDGDLGTVEFDVIGDQEAAVRSLRVLNAMVVDRSARAMQTVTRPVVAQARLSAREATLVGQNYPNPFNPETWVPFQTSEAASVSLRIYDSQARPVRALQLGYRPAGAYVERDRAAYWDGRNDLGERVSSGVYYYEFTAGAYRRLGRMVIVK